LKNEAAKKEQTAAAQMAKLKNNMQALAITVGTALLPVINDLVAAIMPYIQSAANWVRNNKALAGTIVKVALAASGLAYGISIVAGAIGVYQKAAVIARSAQLAWNAAMLANPIGLVIIGVAALAVGIYALSKAWDTTTRSQRLNAEVHQRVLDKTIDQRVEVMNLFTTLRNARIGTDQYNDTLKKIEAISPGITKQYNLQAGALDNINRAEKALIGNIMKRAETEARAEIMREKMKESLRAQQEGPSFWDKAWEFSKRSTLAIGTLGTSEAFGFGKSVTGTAEQANQQYIAGLNADVNQLAKQEVKSANPELAKAKNTEQKVVFEFSGLPDWMKASIVSNAGNGTMPVLGKNK